MRRSSRRRRRRRARAGWGSGGTAPPAGDSREEALRYLDETVGDVGRATSRERKEAFVDGVSGFVDLAERHGVRFARAADYPDYYPEWPGGKIGRALEVEPFDVKRIGPWWESARGQDGVPAPVKTDDFWLLSRAWSTAGGFVRGARVVFRTIGSLARGRKAVGMGAALAASLLEVATKLGVEIWLSSPATALVVDGERVVGVRTDHEGRSLTIRATPRRRARRWRLRPQPAVARALPGRGRHRLVRIEGQRGLRHLHRRRHRRRDRTDGRRLVGWLGAARQRWSCRVPRQRACHAVQHHRRCARRAFRQTSPSRMSTSVTTCSSTRRGCPAATG
ncbi:FAD-binding protein [Tessaracoccus flavescens]|uniref:FAD-dependent oxidoreductase 2 FAD-binding domain-containing protein n=1 Tax=Tessaracoccus flavescens TaxID=399497 RepID=A0A1Q2CYE2_9ACTN|nr:FAD-binding protein [Tessaracoccus flavescens]AQP51176.1 hypothetical protein BW733_10375 [Tessaracoccus flavescens]